MAISIGSFPLLWTNPGEVRWSGTWNLSANLADVILLEPFQNPEPFVQNLPERFMQLVGQFRKLTEFGSWSIPTLQGYTETMKGPSEQCQVGQEAMMGLPLRRLSPSSLSRNFFPCKVIWHSLVRRYQSSYTALRQLVVTVVATLPGVVSSSDSSAT